MPQSGFWADARKLPTLIKSISSSEKIETLLPVSPKAKIVCFWLNSPSFESLFKVFVPSLRLWEERGE
jgi:hypothetical protein